MNESRSILLLLLLDGLPSKNHTPIGGKNMKKETTIALSYDDAMCIERTIAIIKAIASARVCTSGGYITVEDLKYLAEVGKGNDPEEKVDMTQINFMGWSMLGVNLVTDRGDK